MTTRGLAQDVQARRVEVPLTEAQARQVVDRYAATIEV